jgi:hypothetical protein
VRILPVAALLIVSAPLSPRLARRLGARLTVAGGLAAIGTGLLWNAAVSSASASYASFIPGLLLVGFGAGLLLPAATNSVVGAVPQGDSGVGSATNAVALQLGGALGVAVIGSVLSTRYRDRLGAALAGHHVPTAAGATILGSLGGALAVAREAGGALGAGLAHLARSAFMSGNAASLGVGAGVVFAGALVVLAFMPGRERPVRDAAGRPRLAAGTSPGTGHA